MEGSNYEINATDWVLYEDTVSINLDVIESSINVLLNEYKANIKQGLDNRVNRDYHQRWIALRQLMYLLKQ